MADPETLRTGEISAAPAEQQPSPSQPIPLWDDDTKMPGSWHQNANTPGIGDGTSFSTSVAGRGGSSSVSESTAGKEGRSVALVMVSYPKSPLSLDAERYLSRVISLHVGPFWARQLGLGFSLKVIRAGSISLERDPCQGSPESWGRAADPSLADEARRQLGSRFLQAQHVVYAWEGRSHYCGAWEGLAVGWDKATGTSAIWMNGVPREHEHDTGVLAHEFGHTFGLPHSSSLTCRSGTARESDAQWPACSPEEYGNLVDVMGGAFRLGSVSAGVLWRNGHRESLQAQVISPSAPASVSLAPLSADSGSRAAVLSIGDLTYVVEYRTPTGYDRALNHKEFPGGPGVYVTLTRESADPASDGEDEHAWASRNVFNLDGDLRTSDTAPGNYSKHLPLYRPMRLRDGSHLTVVRAEDSARVHFTPPGVLPPAPPRPVPPGSLRSHLRGDDAFVAWQGDGSGTDFQLQALDARGEWKDIKYHPYKPGQAQVRATATLAWKWRGLRVRAINQSGKSPYVNFALSQRSQ